MKDWNDKAFVRLFKEAYQKCFGSTLAGVLSETESKHFSNKIFEATGLVIGAKSIKNYSAYIVNPAEGKSENPSTATLDTLARYVTGAPYTNEINRKNNESHYPYWFNYKRNLEKPRVKPLNKQSGIGAAILVLVTIVIIILYIFAKLKHDVNTNFTERFTNVSEDTLSKHGWTVKFKNAKWWDKRDFIAHHLTLFTLMGDNWADSVHSPHIPNLLLRKLPSDCFTAEIDFDNFVPHQNWQQAGILLLEDTTLSSRSVRISWAYNSYFGGYKKPAEILVQAISSDSNDYTKPEEILHLPVFNIESNKKDLIKQNLKRAALKIEKNGNNFRLLYAAGSMQNSAFREALYKDIDITPKYIGIFAIQGFVNKSPDPVSIVQFKLKGKNCNK
jgi:hypothetical protein